MILPLLSAPPTPNGITTMENIPQMKYLVIDCETSGLFDFAKPADAAGQPRLATLALIICDEAFEVLGRLDLMVKPDGWEMSEETSKVNGLTTEQLLANGVPILEVLKHYTDLVDRGLIVLTFNAQFDTKILRGELRRAGLDDRFEKTLNICLMRAATPVCKVPRKSGAGYKFPKLGEACVFFKVPLIGAHSAMGDAEAARGIAVALRNLRMLPEPAVYVATQKSASMTAPADLQGGAVR